MSTHAARAQRWWRHHSRHAGRVPRPPVAEVSHVRARSGAPVKSPGTHLIVVVQPDDGGDAPVLGLVPPLHAPGVGEQPQVVGPHLVGEDSNTGCVEHRLVGVVHQHRLPARQRAPTGHDSRAEEAHGEIRGRDAGRQRQGDATVEGGRGSAEAAGRHRPAQQRDCVPPCNCRGQDQAPRAETPPVRSRRRLPPPWLARRARRRRRDPHDVPPRASVAHDWPRGGALRGICRLAVSRHAGASAELSRSSRPSPAPRRVSVCRQPRRAVRRHGPAVAVQGAAGMRQPEHSRAQAGGGDPAAGASPGVWRAEATRGCLRGMSHQQSVPPGSLAAGQRSGGLRVAARGAGAGKWAPARLGDPAPGPGAWGVAPHRVAVGSPWPGHAGGPGRLSQTRSTALSGLA